MKNKSIHIANMPKYGYAEYLSKSVSVTPQRYCGFIVPKFCMDSQSLLKIQGASVLATQTRLKSLYEGMTLQNMALPNMQGGSYRPRVNPLTLISQISVNQLPQNCKEAIMPNQYYNLAIEDGFSPFGYRVILNNFHFATKEQEKRQIELLEKYAPKNVKFLIVRVGVDIWQTNDKKAVTL